MLNIKNVGTTEAVKLRIIVENLYRTRRKVANTPSFMVSVLSKYVGELEKKIVCGSELSVLTDQRNQLEKLFAIYRVYWPTLKLTYRNGNTETYTAKATLSKSAFKYLETAWFSRKSSPELDEYPRVADDSASSSSSSSSFTTG